MLLVLTLRTLSLGYFSGIESQWRTEYSTITLTIFLPCIYLYFKNLSLNKKNFNKKDGLHFLIPLLLCASITLNKQGIPYFKLLVFLTIGVIGTYYLVKSYLLLKSNIWNIEINILHVKKQEIVIKNWSLFFFSICFLTIIRAIFSFLGDLHFEENSFGERYYYASLFINLILFCKILITPEVLYGYSFFNEKIDEQRNTNLELNKIWILNKTINITNLQDIELNKKISDKIPSYIRLIENEAIKETYFRSKDQSLAEMGKTIKIPKSHLIFIFKYHSTLSFNAFKKVVKIVDAINLIETNYLGVNTLESLATIVGFTSYSTFFTSFKDFTGVTPRIYSQEYAKKIA